MRSHRRAWFSNPRSVPIESRLAGRERHLSPLAGRGRRRRRRVRGGRQELNSCIGPSPGSLARSDLSPQAGRGNGACCTAKRLLWPVRLLLITDAKTLETARNGLTFI